MLEDCFVMLAILLGENQVRNDVQKDACDCKKAQQYEEMSDDR
jgi:hypothetical protein